MRGFSEGSLAFDPTYKYNFNSTEYDTSDKLRIPAWCDRVIYEENEDLGCIFYGRAELRLSDHRPVFSLFEAKIRKINEKARQEIEQVVISKYNQLHPVSPIHMRKAKTTIASSSQRALQAHTFTEKVVEPSIGDFGIVETLDEEEEVKQAPPDHTSKSMVIKDPKQLDDLISRASLLVDEAEKLEQDEIYQKIFEEEQFGHLPTKTKPEEPVIYQPE